MSIEYSGAIRLKKRLAEVHHPAEQIEDCLQIEHWGMWIRMLLETHSARGGKVTVTYRVITYVDRLMAPVVDYAIGWGSSLEEANEMAVNVYMGSVFPVVHSICCTEHCGYGVENERHYAKDVELGIVNDWRIINGPQVIIGEHNEVPRDFFSNILGQQFDELTKSSGSYWYKCFAGNLSEVEADCFMNNARQEHYKQEIIRQVATLPPSSTCKQHLLLWPDDQELVETGRQRRRDRWKEALGNDPSVASKDEMGVVLVGFEAFFDFAEMEEEFLLNVLLERSLSIKDSRKVLAFLPSVCARCSWEPLGVQFSDKFQLLHYESRKSIEVAFESDGLFRASMRLVRRLYEQGQDNDFLDFLLDFGAQHRAILQASANPDFEPKNMKMKYFIVPSDHPIDGKIDNGLLQVLGMGKKWWQFWK